MSDEVRVNRDTLDQWTEDALTQGVAPATYVYATLNAALRDHEAPAASAAGHEEDAHG